MRIKTHFFTILSLLLASASIAQNNTSSPYSIRAYGELESFNNAFTKSLGGATNGIRSPRCISLGNPASLGAINMVLLDFGFRADGNKVYSESAVKTKYNGNFNYFSLTFPMYRKSIIKKDTTVKNKTTKLYKEYRTVWAGSFGITPYSSINASYSKIKDTTYGQINNLYSSIGGLSRFFFINSVNLTKNFSLGLNTSYIFGQSRSYSGFYVADSGITRATIDEKNTRMSGFKFDFGLQGQLHDTLTRMDSVMENNVMVLKKKRYPIRVVYGATLNNNAQLNYTVFRQILNKSNYYTVAGVDTVLLEENKTGKTSLPLGYSAGLSITYNNLWMITADYRSERWGDMKRGLFTDSFTNSSQFNIGLAYRPDANVDMFKRREKNRRYKANLEYRVGFRTLNTGYNFKDNAGIISPLKEYGISFGIGIPKTRMDYDQKQVVVKSMINITGEYIHRGTTTNGMIAEDMFRLTVGFTLADIWFVKRKYN